MAELQNGTERSLLACGLWLHAGLVGTPALAAGLIQLFDGEANGLLALALAIAGGVLALASWRRGRTVLDDAARASAAGTDAAGRFASRASSRQAGRGAIRALSSIPLQANRSRGDDRRYTTSD